MSPIVQAFPLFIILILLLPPFRYHMMVAGFVGALFAIIAGGIPMGQVTSLYLGGLGQMMGITAVMVFGATAMVLAKLGCSRALMNLLKRGFREHLPLMIAGMVLVQALATYAAGCGAANTLVTAPLIASAVGFVPQVVAGLSIVSGASWATSPASAESAYISSQMGVSVVEYAEFMRPFTFAFWGIGMALAAYGIWAARRRGTLKLNSGGDQDELAGETTGQLVKRAIPFGFLLLAILVGPPINRSLGIVVFTPVTTAVMTLVLAALLLRVKPNELGESLIDGGTPILRYLFLVGLFLGYIKIMEHFGTFAAIATLPGLLPVALVTVGALVVAFLIAIPSAAYTVAIDAMIIPILAAVGVPVWAFGFVGIAVAQGAMISPVQINVAATAHGFRKDIMDVIRVNLPYMPIVLIVTIIIAVLVT